MLSPRIIDKDSRNRVERALRGENSLPKGDKPLDWVLNRNESKGPLEEAILRFFLFDEIPDELSGQKPRRVERPIEEKCRGKATPF